MNFRGGRRGASVVDTRGAPWQSGRVHELAIAQSILEQVQEVVAREGLGRVQAIRLRIGALRAVVPECLEIGFQSLSRGTPLEGARLEIEEVPLRLRCRDCGAESAPEDGLAWLCPACGGPGVDLIAGRELALESLEVED